MTNDFYVNNGITEIYLTITEQRRWKGGESMTYAVVTWRAGAVHGMPCRASLRCFLVLLIYLRGLEYDDALCGI